MLVGFMNTRGCFFSTIFIRAFYAYMTTRPTSFTLLRHGQSTWNKASRIQGSSDFSHLTDKGREQARRAAEHLVSLGWSDEIDAVWSSPLTRARQTADIVLPSLPNALPNAPRIALAGDDTAKYRLNDALREIDLYAFQGIDKDSVPEEFLEAYAAWKANPAEFEIDGHRPVIELWDRAADAWRDLRAGTGDLGTTSALVVAHNATNQALLCTAMGLPPSTFRKVLQSNAAVSRVTFPDADGDRVVMRCINRAPEPVLNTIGKYKGEGELMIMSCGEMRLDAAARETALGSRATVVEADATACDAIVKERLGVARNDVGFASDEGGLTVFHGDCLLCFNCG